MEKRKRHNLLLLLAVAILLIGALVQVYFIITAGEKPAAYEPPDSISQPK